MQEQAARAADAQAAQQALVQEQTARAADAQAAQQALVQEQAARAADAQAAQQALVQEQTGRASDAQQAQQDHDLFKSHALELLAGTCAPLASFSPGLLQSLNDRRNDVVTALTHNNPHIRTAGTPVDVNSVTVVQQACPAVQWAFTITRENQVPPIPHHNGIVVTIRAVWPVATAFGLAGGPRFSRPRADGCAIITPGEGLAVALGDIAAQVGGHGGGGGGGGIFVRSEHPGAGAWAGLVEWEPIKGRGGSKGLFRFG